MYTLSLLKLYAIPDCQPDAEETPTESIITLESPPVNMTNPSPASEVSNKRDPATTQQKRSRQTGTAVSKTPAKKRSKTANKTSYVGWV